MRARVRACTPVWKGSGWREGMIFAVTCVQEQGWGTGTAGVASRASPLSTPARRPLPPCLPLSPHPFRLGSLFAPSLQPWLPPAPHPVPPPTPQSIQTRSHDTRTMKRVAHSAGSAPDAPPAASASGAATVAALHNTTPPSSSQRALTALTRRPAGSWLRTNPCGRQKCGCLCRNESSQAQEVRVSGL
eukprot:364701-Chlamydomonas_euryale.AAC.7